MIARATYLLERGGLAAGDVVDIQAAVLDEVALGPAVADLGDADVAAVLVVEEHDGGPVVGQVLLEGARRAGRLARQVVRGRVHRDVERVAADNLVQVRRVGHARVDERVGTLDDQLRAGESKHVLRGDILPEQCRGGQRGPVHGGVIVDQVDMRTSRETIWTALRV